MRAHDFESAASYMFIYQDGGGIKNHAIGKGALKPLLLVLTLGSIIPHGHVDRHLGHPQLHRGLEPGVAREDHVVLLDDDRHAEAELADGVRDGIDGCIVDAGVPGVRLEPADRPHLDGERAHAESPGICGE